MRKLSKAVSDDLDFPMLDDSEFEILCLEADRLGSFVTRKTNEQSIFFSDRDLKKHKLYFAL